MDEEHRDLYNRFGGRSFDFDPRKDELRLITDVAVVYLFLGITAYLMTLPVGARASRTWLAILGIAMLAVEVTFKLTDTAMPEWMPAALTEHELVFYLHCLFPLAVALLRLLAEALYVDADQTALAVLKEVYIQQKVRRERTDSDHCVPFCSTCDYAWSYITLGHSGVVAAAAGPRGHGLEQDYHRRCRRRRGEAAVGHPDQARRAARAAGAGGRQHRAAHRGPAPVRRQSGVAVLLRCFHCLVWRDLLSAVISAILVVWFMFVKVLYASIRVHVPTVHQTT